MPDWDWSFPDSGQLPMSMLAVENITFAYPGRENLYMDLDFGVDLQTCVALVGPNRAGKTTLAAFISCALAYEWLCFLRLRSPMRGCDSCLALLVEQANDYQNRTKMM